MDRFLAINGLQPTVGATDLDSPTLRRDERPRSKECRTSGTLRKNIYSHAHNSIIRLIVETAPKTSRPQQLLRRIFRQAHLPPHIYIVLSSTTNWHADFEQKLEMASDGAIFYKGYPIYLVDEMSALIDFLGFVRKERGYTGEVHIMVAVNKAYRLCWADVWAIPQPLHLYGWKDDHGQPLVTLYSNCSSGNGSRKFEGTIRDIEPKPWYDQFDSDGGASDASSAVVPSEASRVDSAVSVPISKQPSVCDDVPVRATRAMDMFSPMARSRSTPPSSPPTTLDPTYDGRFHSDKEGIGAADLQYYPRINALNQLMPPYSQHLVPSNIFLLDSGVPRDGPKGSSPEVQRAREAWHRLRRYDFSTKEGNADSGPTEGEGAEDKTGHGTRVASLFLRTAPSARLTVCKVVTDREDPETGHWTGPPSAPLVAQALRKAREEKADIIIMPLGFREEHHLVEAEFALIKKQDKTEARQTLIICSTSNAGQTNNIPVSWPASREGIFGVSAADYFGKPDGRAPRACDSRRGRETNYLSLGAKATVFRRDGEPEVKRAGAASYAAPILGALAALILQTLRTYSRDTTKPKAAAALSGIKEKGWEYLFRCFATKPTADYDPFLPLWEAFTPVTGMDALESALDNIHKKYSSLVPYDI